MTHISISAREQRHQDIQENYGDARRPEVIQDQPDRALRGRLEVGRLEERLDELICYLL